MAGDDLLPDFADLLVGRLVGEELVRLDEDVPGALFRDHHGLGRAFVHELDQIEAAGGSGRSRYLAGLQLLHDLGELGRDLAGPAPADLAALQCILGVGLGDGHLLEVGALLDLAVNALGLRVSLLQLGG